MTASGSHTLIYATLMWQSVFLLVCTEIGIVIANQSADWCGNPPDVPRTTGEAQRLPLLTKGSWQKSLIFD